MVSKFEKRVYGCFSYIYNFLWACANTFLMSDHPAITTIRIFLVMTVSGSLFVCGAIFAGKYFDLFGFAKSRDLNVIDFTLEFIIGSLFLISTGIALLFFLAIISVIAECINRTYFESIDKMIKKKKEKAAEKNNT
jgi:hypothetical protein